LGAAKYQRGLFCKATLKDVVLLDVTPLKPWYRNAGGVFQPSDSTATPRSTKIAGLSRTAEDNQSAVTIPRLPKGNVKNGCGQQASLAGVQLESITPSHAQG